MCARCPNTQYPEDQRGPFVFMTVAFFALALIVFGAPFALVLLS